MKTRSSILGMFAAGTSAAALMLSGCGGGGGGSNLAQFCKDNTTLASQFGSVADLDNGGPSSIADFKEASAAVKKVEAHAPSDVKGDIKLVVSALDDAGRARHGVVRRRIDTSRDRPNLDLRPLELRRRVDRYDCVSRVRAYGLSTARASRSVPNAVRIAR